MPDFTFKSHVRVKCGKSARGLLSSQGERCVLVCLKQDNALFVIQIFNGPVYFAFVPPSIAWNGVFMKTLACRSAHLSLCLETPSELFEDHHDCFNIFRMLKVPDYYCHVIFCLKLSFELVIWTLAIIKLLEGIFRGECLGHFSCNIECLRVLRAVCVRRELRRRVVHSDPTRPSEVVWSRELSVRAACERRSSSLSGSPCATGPITGLHKQTTSLSRLQRFHRCHRHSSQKKRQKQKAAVFALWPW